MTTPSQSPSQEPGIVEVPESDKVTSPPNPGSSGVTVGEPNTSPIEVQNGDQNPPLPNTTSSPGEDERQGNGGVMNADKDLLEGLEPDSSKSSTVPQGRESRIPVSGDEQKGVRGTPDGSQTHEVETDTSNITPNSRSSDPAVENNGIISKLKCALTGSKTNDSKTNSSNSTQNLKTERSKSSTHDSFSSSHEDINQQQGRNENLNENKGAFEGSKPKESNSKIIHPSDNRRNNSPRLWGRFMGILKKTREPKNNTPSQPSSNPSSETVQQSSRGIVDKVWNQFKRQDNSARSPTNGLQKVDTTKDIQNEAKNENSDRAAGTALASVNAFGNGLDDMDRLITPNAEDNLKVTQHAAMGSEDIQKILGELSECRRQFTELQKRCEAQSRDLQNLNNHLNAADKSSDADIIQALNRLNAEVQQDTAYMAESLAEDPELCFGTRKLTKGQTDALRTLISEKLVEALGEATPESIPMLLQIAFQGYLVSTLHRMISSWAFEPSLHTDPFMDNVYQRLRTKEVQAISGRWRVLARVHIPHDKSANLATHVEGIIAGLSDILLAAGCAAVEPDMTCTAKVGSKFKERITLLVELAHRLNKSFDEVISSDFGIFIVSPHGEFKDTMMEPDTDDGQVATPGERVLCTTHLGLVKRMPEGGSLWEKREKKEMMVLKARVLLESFLETS